LRGEGGELPTKAKAKAKAEAKAETKAETNKTKLSKLSKLMARKGQKLNTISNLKIRRSHINSSTNKQINSSTHQPINLLIHTHAAGGDTRAAAIPLTF